MPKWKLDGIWNHKSDAIAQSIILKKSGVYTTKIKKTKFKDDAPENRTGWGVYKKSRVD